MVRIILRWAVGVVAILATIWTARMLGMHIEWEPPWHVIIFVPVLAIINAIIGPILRLLSMPINCLTFGLFSFILNAFLFWAAGKATGGEMDVLGALVGSIIYGVLSTVFSWPIKESSS